MAPRPMTDMERFWLAVGIVDQMMFQATGEPQYLFSADRAEKELNRSIRRNRTGQRIREVKGEGGKMKVVGIDLTGSEKRASGFAVLSENDLVFTSRIRTDEVLITEAVYTKPDVVSIDSPLSLPEDPTKIYRSCELELKRRGIGVYWCLLPSMKALTLRGIALAEALRAKGLKVIESYPGAAQDLLGIPRKGKGVEALREGLRQYGIVGDLGVTHDELDAVTAAIVGLLYLHGAYEALGCLILPKKSKRG